LETNETSFPSYLFGVENISPILKTFRYLTSGCISVYTQFTGHL